MLELNNPSNSYEQLKTINCKCLHEGDYNCSTVEISIIVPTYKRSESLIDTIASCAPIYKNDLYEIIVVFNAKGEANTLVDFIKENAINNIKVFENEDNIGMFQNWNMCISKASGKWVSIIHDDDMFEERYFDYLARIINEIPAQTAYINFAGRIIQKEHYCDLHEKRKSTLTFRTIKKNDFCILGVSPFYAITCGTLINRDAWISLGGIDLETYPSGDVLMPLKMINNGYKCLICGSKVNYYRHLSNASLKKEVMDGFIYFYIELQKNIYGSLRGLKKYLYHRYKNCLEFKAVNHVFVQAEKCGIQLDSSRPDPKIQSMLRYRLMDIFQRAYWKLRAYDIKVDVGGIK